MINAFRKVRHKRSGSFWVKCVFGCGTHSTYPYAYICHTFSCFFWDILNVFVWYLTSLWTWNPYVCICYVAIIEPTFWTNEPAFPVTSWCSDCWEKNHRTQPAYVYSKTTSDYDRMERADRRVDSHRPRQTLKCLFPGDMKGCCSAPPEQCCTDIFKETCVYDLRTESEGDNSVIVDSFSCGFRWHGIILKCTIYRDVFHSRKS